MFIIFESLTLPVGFFVFVRGRGAMVAYRSPTPRMKVRPLPVMQIGRVADEVLALD